MNIFFDHQEKQQQKNHSVPNSRKKTNASISCVNAKLDNTLVNEGKGTSPHISKQWLNLCKAQFQFYCCDSVSALNSSEILCEFEARLSLRCSAPKPKPWTPYSAYVHVEGCRALHSYLLFYFEHNKKIGAVNHLFRPISLIAYFRKTQLQTKLTMYLLGN